MSTKPKLKIYIPLLDEGTDVFVGALCRELTDNTAIIVSIDEFHDAKPAFGVGDEVEFSERNTSEGVLKVAIKKCIAE